MAGSGRLVFAEIAKEMRRAYAVIESLYRPGQSVLVGHPLAVSARVFEDRHGAPAATVILQPNVLRSELRQPVLPDGRDISGWPRWAKRALWWLADRVVVDPKLVPALNRWRAELELSPVKRLFHGWILSPQRIVGLFPEWFAQPQPDWPERLRMTGFPLFDDREHRPLDAELDAWLDAGAAPVAFTAGTANRHAQRFFTSAVEAAGLLGTRAVLLTGDRDQVPAELPDGVRHVGYAPFSELFPRCAAVVHHGGVGTCSQGLHAGVPQLLLPMAFDQPDNAVRLRRLGVGRALPSRRANGNRVAAELRVLLRDDATAAACRRWRGAMERAEPIRAACDVLEEITALPPAPPTSSPALPEDEDLG